MTQMPGGGAARVEEALAARGMAGRVRQMPASTRTAADAAAAIGCSVAQIAKSLVFRTRGDARPVLAIASGVNRVDEAKLARAAGEPIERADADYTRTMTGFAIGGVPPLGHANQIATFIDADLERYDQIWAAAGTPFAVFALTPAELVAITAGVVSDLRVD